MEIHKSAFDSTIETYEFNKDEKEIILKGFESEYKRIKAKILRLITNRRNEGQAKYIIKSDHLWHELHKIEKVISHFKNKTNEHN